MCIMICMYVYNDTHTHTHTQIEPSQEHNDSYIKWTRAFKSALYESSSPLSQFQCSETEAGPWDNSKTFDHSVEEMSVFLLMKNHWESEVREKVER